MAAIRRDKTATPAHLLAEEDALSRVKFDVAPGTQLEERPNGLE